jgi:gliding motility-associated-like protein
VVTVNPLPVTSAITGIQTPACGATGIVYSVTLTSGSTYTWAVPAGSTITSGGTGPNNNSIIVNFGTNNGNITVVETLPTGCSGAQRTLAISLQGCALNANFTASSTAICSGSNVIFTDLSTGVSGSTIYSWNFGTGASPSTATGAGPHNVVYTYIGPEMMTVSLVITEGASDTETKTNYITINPLPTATISGTTSVCKDGPSPNITFTGSNGTTPFTITYRINSGSNQTVTTTVSNSISIPAPTTTAGSFTYTLVSVRDASSTACSQTQSGSAVITVNPLPTATINGTTVVCKDTDPPNVTFTGANGIAPFTFTYRLNGGGNQTITTVTGNSISISAPTTVVGTFTYALVSVKDASSTTCSQSQSGSAVVTVNPLPTATINGTTAVCKDAVAPNITFTGANGTAPYTFTYNINSGASQTVTTVVGNSVTVPAPTTTVGTYTYALVNVRDASATTCQQVQGGTATITVNPLPTATISGTTSVCKDGISPVITFMGANGTSPYTFTYNINSGSNQTVTTTTGNSVMVSVPTGTAGTFTYSLISVRDASSTACLQNQTGSAVITVNPLPVATISGTSAVCRNAASPNITFTGGNGTAPYTFTYTVNSGSNQTITTTSGNSVTVAAPTTIVGIFTYALVSVRDASSTICSQTQGGSATITVNPLPTATISGTTTVCKDGPSPNVTFTGAGGTAPYTFTYTINGGSNLTASTTSGNSVNVSVATSTSGTFTYSLVSVRDASSTTCSQSQSGNAVVTVSPLPTATISGTTSVCKDGSSPLITFTGADGSAPYTFTYEINGGSDLTITTTTANSVSVAVPTAITGTFTYSLVSIRDGSPNTCLRIQGGSATVTVNPLPTATISGAAVVCRAAASPIVTFTGANGTAPYTFTYRINSGSNQLVTTTTGNSVTVSAPTGTAGVYTYTLVGVRDASLSTCYQAQTGSAVVTVNAYPVANAGNGGNECDLNFTFSAVPSIGTGTWSKTSGPGTVSFTPNAMTPNATVTVSAYGTYTFTWTEINGTCSNSSTITVNFYQNPVPNPGSGGNECDLNFIFSAVPSIGTGTWTRTSGPGTATFAPNANSATATVTVSAYGAYTFAWTEVNVACSASGAVTVNFYQQPVANAGSGGNNCGLDYILSAVPSVGTGTWTRTSGPGTAIFMPDANAPNAQVSVSAYGAYTFRWTEFNGTCSDYASINVNFIKAPSANAGTGGSECDLDFNLSAVQGSGTTGIWTKVSGPGNVLFTPGPSLPDAVVTVDQFGEYEFAWTEVNSFCQSTAQINVIFRNLPAVYAGRDTVLCKGATVQLGAHGTGTMHWTPETAVSNPDIGNPVASPPDSTNFIVRLTDQFGCINYDTVIVDVWEIPVADAGPDMILEYLFGTTMAAVDLKFHEAGTWSLVSGTGDILEPDSESSSVTDLTLGENVFRWKVSNGVCPDSEDNMTITVHDLVIPTLITPNGDQNNEYFILRGIETLGKTELIIFDRRGAQVYRNPDYQNDWNGLENNGNPLPDDTYFYVVKSQNGKSLSGYIVIRR